MQQLQIHFFLTFAPPFISLSKQSLFSKTTTKNPANHTNKLKMWCFCQTTAETEKQNFWEAGTQRDTREFSGNVWRRRGLPAARNTSHSQTGLPHSQLSGARPSVRPSSSPQLLHQAKLEKKQKTKNLPRHVGCASPDKHERPTDRGDPGNGRSKSPDDAAGLVAVCQKGEVRV